MKRSIIDLTPMFVPMSFQCQFITYCVGTRSNDVQWRQNGFNCIPVMLGMRCSIVYFMPVVISWFSSKCEVMIGRWFPAVYLAPCTLASWFGWKWARISILYSVGQLMLTLFLKRNIIIPNVKYSANTNGWTSRLYTTGCAVCIDSKKAYTFWICVCNAVLITIYYKSW